MFLWTVEQHILHHYISYITLSKICLTIRFGMFLCRNVRVRREAFTGNMGKYCHKKTLVTHGRYSRKARPMEL